MDEFGSQGSEAGQFKYPFNIAIMDNQIYITDYGNHRIQIFERRIV